VVIEALDAMPPGTIELGALAQDAKAGVTPARDGDTAAQTSAPEPRG
jgi:hypothetical protein